MQEIGRDFCHVVDICNSEDSWPHWPWSRWRFEFQH